MNEKVNHVVVLMLENRSFDHMLGYLPGSWALSGDEFNRLNPDDLGSEKVFVNPNASYTGGPDPLHDFLSVRKQMFANADPAGQAPPMNGFVLDNIQTEHGDVERGKQIMDCFAPQAVPALSALADEFCLCTHWFASVPGPTWPNRFFVHAATCDGDVGNDIEHPYEMKTIFESLGEQGFSWRVYFSDFPHCLSLRRLWAHLDHFKDFEDFQEDARNGALANYTFIEPRYLDFLEWKATDQHPPHDVRQGEYFIAEVYETLRNSPLWEQCLLVVTYDEHGGFYDQVPPPGDVPNPDGKRSMNPPFDFTRLGVRVPAVLVSPWIEKGTVDGTIYEHSSVPATLKKLFGLPQFLTARDRSANTFERVLTRSSPREDAPQTLPVPGTPGESDAQRALIRTSSHRRELPAGLGVGKPSQALISEFQATLTGLASRLLEEIEGAGPAGPAALNNEHEAAVHVQESIRRLLKL